MSLDWDLKNCKGGHKQFREKAEKDKDGEQLYKLKPLTYELIWACGLSIGIPEITEENWGDVLARLHYFADQGQPLIDKWEGKKSGPKTKTSPITAELIKQHIGLHTNGDSFGWKKLKENVAIRKGQKVALTDGTAA